MTRSPDCNFAKVSAALIGAAACAYVVAQTPRQPAVGQVNPQVNTALYGGGVPASVRYANPYPSSVALPSEVRHAYWKSGALPSEIRMGYAAMGPLDPGGPLAYIPPAPSYRSTAAPPPPMGAAAFTNSSVRYSSPPPASSTAVGSKPVAPRAISPAPINTAIANPGTVRYGR